MLDSIRNSIPLLFNPAFFQAHPTTAPLFVTPAPTTTTEPKPIDCNLAPSSSKEPKSDDRTVITEEDECMVSLLYQGVGKKVVSHALEKEHALVERKILEEIEKEGMVEESSEKVVEDASEKAIVLVEKAQKEPTDDTSDKELQTDLLNLCPSPSSASVGNKKDGDDWVFEDVMNAHLVSEKHLEETDQIEELEGDFEETKDDCFVQRKGKGIATRFSTPKRKASGIVIHDLEEGIITRTRSSKRLRMESDDDEEETLSVRKAKKGKATLPTRFSLRKVKEESGKKEPKVTDHRVIDEEWCRSHDLSSLWEILEIQGWTKAFWEEEEVNPERVREFCKKLKIVKVQDMLVGSYEIQGKKLGFTSIQVVEVMDVPHEGDTIYEKSKWPFEYKKEDVLGRITTLSQLSFP